MESLSGKLTIIILLFLSLLVYQFYSACIISFLVTVDNTPEFNSMEQLVNANGYRVQIVANGVTLKNLVVRALL